MYSSIRNSNNFEGLVEIPPPPAPPHPRSNYWRRMIILIKHSKQYSENFETVLHYFYYLDILYWIFLIMLHNLNPAFHLFLFEEYMISLFRTLRTSILLCTYVISKYFQLFQNLIFCTDWLHFLSENVHSVNKLAYRGHMLDISCVFSSRYIPIIPQVFLSNTSVIFPV